MESKNKIKQEQRIDKILRPFQDFVNAEISSGIILIITVIIALIMANGPLKELYFDLWLSPFSISFGSYFILTKPIILWINDGLMALFFLLVGLEIKREFLVGELASFKKILLPIFCALGGMLVPALIFIFFNLNSPWLNAWAIPIATDIAFTLGILALLHKRVPSTLKLFLVSFAIIDDIGGVLIIAFFYTEKLAFDYLFLSVILVAVLISYNRLGGKTTLVYMIIGLFIWFFILKSGIHATIAGVLLAMTIPATNKINVQEFKQHATYYIDSLSFEDLNDKYENEIHLAAIKHLEVLCKNTETPLQRLEHSLAPWVAFLIVPIFAFANAGVDISLIFSSIQLIDLIVHPVFLGILFGLIIGNPIGITSFVYFTHRLGWVNLPSKVTWIHVFGISWLAGVGFTLSQFIASLAFGGAEDILVLNISRFVILIGSLIAGLIGYIILYFSEDLNKSFNSN